MAPAARQALPGPSQSSGDVDVDRGGRVTTTSDLTPTPPLCPPENGGGHTLQARPYSEADLLSQPPPLSVCPALCSDRDLSFLGATSDVLTSSPWCRGSATSGRGGIVL